MKTTDHITFTGQDDLTMTPIGRDELIEMVKRAGATYHSSICSLSTILVASDAALDKQTLKLRKARAQGVRVISYSQFFREYRDLRCDQLEAA